MSFFSFTNMINNSVEEPCKDDSGIFRAGQRQLFEQMLHSHGESVGSTRQEFGTVLVSWPIMSKHFFVERQ